MAPVTAADLWRGFSRDKIVRFQRDLMRPCQMRRSVAVCPGGQETNMELVASTELARFKTIGFQCYRMICNFFWSWSSILLVWSREAISVLSSLASKAYDQRRDMMGRVKQVFSLLVLLATRAIEWRSGLVRKIASRVMSSFCSPQGESFGKLQLKKRLHQICDRIGALLEDSFGKLQLKRRLHQICDRIWALLEESFGKLQLKRRLHQICDRICALLKESFGKLQWKRRLHQICDRIGALRDQWVKIQKKAVYIVNYKVVMFFGVVAAQALLVYFLYKSRASRNIKECQRTLQLSHQHMPSVWYYEHVHHYPRPQMKMLTGEDGAAPILSQLPVSSREITIATHTTMDRFPAVEMTAFRWSGPMVLVVLVRIGSEVASTYSALKDLHARIEAEGRCRLHIQVVREEGFKSDAQALQALYPVNSMRNLALGMVTTNLVFMIDADFVPNPGLHEHLTQHEEKFVDLVRKADDWRQLLVVPAFELSEDKSIRYEHSLHILPHTKDELREAWWNGIVDCFRCDVSPDSHQSTEYYKYTDPAVTWPYQAWYKEGYEPFYIASVNHLPKFDSRFRGHGKNKISHTYLLSLEGFTFWVIPEGFLVELPHPPSLSEKRKVQDPLQTWRIDGIYNRFMSEVNSIHNITTVSKNSVTETKETLC